ncbi:hypothetical protein [Streptomyces scabiei]|jgi:hydrogenase-4 membrane subunit HyfE|uniref:hypothetical protein n=1 Tax=Streptomyces scabiei TaxID=1930 RepID=UPI0029BCBB1B|nr:hypothetical protein [Streptomyces scabiei]MDX3199969.1 hypothetical protein [Streptomyces scabiei]MDX3217763.1 hypothetical protein [Streptomyces scabiei]
MPSLFISLMRTAVPLVAGWLLSLAVWAGVEVDSQAVTGAVTLALALAYYALFRLLELLGVKARGTVLQKLAGFLLGWARPPAYPAEPSLPPVARYRGGPYGE